MSNNTIPKETQGTFQYSSSIALQIPNPSNPIKPQNSYKITSKDLSDDSSKNSNEEEIEHSSSKQNNKNLISLYTDDTIKSFKACEIIKSHEQSINSIDFSPDINKPQILTSSDDNSITVYDVLTNHVIKQLVNKTYGCEKAIFTHNPKAILCASKTDYRIMYWCLHNNELLYSFLGHSDFITDITINPDNDLFLSTSNDRISRLWDLNLRKCLYIFQDSQCGCFNECGNVIVSATNKLNKSDDSYEHYINLYDCKNIQQGPFDVFGIHTKSLIKQIKFSNDGNFLVALTDNEVFILDAFKGKKIGYIYNDEENINMFDISPDSKYIANACESGNINVYDIKGNIIHTLDFHNMSCLCVRFCKDYALIASSCKEMVLWIPGFDDDKNKQINEN